MWSRRFYLQCKIDINIFGNPADPFVGGEYPALTDVAFSARMFVGGHGVVGRDVLLFLPACLLVDDACLAVMCDILTVTVTYKGVRYEPLGAARLEPPRLRSRKFGCC